MKEEQMIIIGASLAGIAYGVVCMTCAPVYKFFSRTRSGRRFASMFGEKAATVINRFIVPTVIILGGIFMIVSELFLKDLFRTP